MKARVHMLVSGEVQGVFFRSRTKYKAEQLGVKGWIRNLPDGRVESVLEGEADAVNSLVDFCRQGSRGALVKNVDLTWEDFVGEFGEFEIKY